jgi:hypothetical protein
VLLLIWISFGTLVFTFGSRLFTVLFTASELGGMINTSTGSHLGHTSRGSRAHSSHARVSTFNMPSIAHIELPTLIKYIAALKVHIAKVKSKRVAEFGVNSQLPKSASSISSAIDRIKAVSRRAFSIIDPSYNTHANGSGHTHANVHAHHTHAGSGLHQQHPQGMKSGSHAHHHEVHSESRPISLTRAPSIHRHAPSDTVPLLHAPVNHSPSPGEYDAHVSMGDGSELMIDLHTPRMSISASPSLTAAPTPGMPNLSRITSYNALSIPESRPHQARHVGARPQLRVSHIQTHPVTVVAHHAPRVPVSPAGRPVMFTRAVSTPTRDLRRTGLSIDVSHADPNGAIIYHP